MSTMPIPGEGWKIMYSENSVHIKKCFRLPIFWIFCFQKKRPHYGRKMVDFFSYLNVEYVISVMWPSPQVIATKTQLYIWDFYEGYYVKSGLIIKEMSNSFQMSDTPYPIPLPYYVCTLTNFHTHQTRPPYLMDHHYHSVLGICICGCVQPSMRATALSCARGTGTIRKRGMGGGPCPAGKS